ncbi:MAG: hypothetical protein FJ095_17900 [Deltaproteobacteria bacterium]|nr:hypothetical protein [Deltaproteobacteria bacterium]
MHTIHRRASQTLLGVALVLTASGTAWATPPATSWQPIERAVRQLSLDLRGNVPEMSDYELVEGAAELPDALIDAYLASDDFRLQMRRYHEALLWTNPSVSLASVSTALGSVTIDGVQILRLTGRRSLYRGGDGTADCQAKPQAVLGYEADGTPKTESFGVVGGNPVRREGYVEIHPYWEANPATVVKVCAFDAQTTASYSIASGPDAGTFSCNTLQGVSRSASCGCGPELRGCTVTAVGNAVLAAFREQLLRSVDDHTVGGAPYSQLVTTKKAYVNGPLSHFLSHVAHTLPLSSIQSGVQPSDGAVPSVPYAAGDTWISYEREAPHAGILTLPGYLLRYQTLRGRANRYRIVFRGQYFEPPSSKDTGCLDVGDDLTLRCVCRGCHTTLEPLAAHFGKFAEAGSVSMADFPLSFATRAACNAAVAPSLTAFCDRFYAVVPSLEDPDIRTWRLKPLRYADSAHPEVQPNFEAGPDGLAQSDIKSGLFHEVAVTHLFEFLMKRPPNLDVTSPDYEGETLATIAKDFREQDDLREAVRALVKLPAYRRLP